MAEVDPAVCSLGTESQGEGGLVLREDISAKACDTKLYNLQETEGHGAISAIDFFGADGRNRTADLLITNPNQRGTCHNLPQKSPTFSGHFCDTSWRWSHPDGSSFRTIFGQSAPQRHIAAFVRHLPAPASPACSPYGVNARARLPPPVALIGRYAKVLYRVYCSINLFGLSTLDCPYVSAPFRGR
jgi:hypothetical protein